MGEPLLGKILFVDLSTKKWFDEPFTNTMASNYMGARGYNAYLLWKLLDRGTDPLGPDNALIFGVGPLTGTCAPSSGRTSVTTKSPATNLYLKTNVGGGWGNELRHAGYSFLVVSGRSEKPVYIWINNGDIQIKSAKHLWGKDVRETSDLIHRELEDSNVEIASIGPAGENKVLFSAIMCSIYNAAARGGVGAVMGSKNLKAIAVRGTKPVRVDNPEGFLGAVNKTWKNLYEQSGARGTHLFGTSGGVPGINALKVFPSYNFQKSYFEKADKISGQYLAEEGYLKRRVGCFSCPMSCHRYVEVEEKPFKNTYTGGPEYETVGALGAGTGVSETGAIIKANELCNIYGLDTISTGSVIQWFMECNQREIEMPSVDIDLSWGNEKTVLKLIHKIAYREGIGDLLAEGTKRAAEVIGQESYKWAVQAKGLEQSRVETRSAYSYALAFAVNPRGPDHLMTETLAEFGLSPEMVQVIEDITGDRKHAVPYSTEKRAEIVRWHEDVYAVTDSLGLCVFGSTAQYYLTPTIMAELFSSATGLSISEDEVMSLGKKIITMERAFNMREGASRKDDKLPYRMRKEVLENAPGDNAINSDEVMDPLLDRYYELHGWDVVSGLPTRKVYEEIGLISWADELESLGLLP
jgi:aldehyde:ferredoxin oxidoreductase